MFLRLSGSAARGKKIGNMVAVLSRRPGNILFGFIDFYMFF